MKRLLLAGILTVLALPAAASGCASFTIENIEGTSHITGRQDVAGIQVNLEGHYLWVNLGEPADPIYPEADVEASHDVAANVIGATVCPDGSVSFTEAEFEPMPELVEEPVEELLTDAEVEELRPETRAVYVATHPGTGGLQEF